MITHVSVFNTGYPIVFSDDSSSNYGIQMKVFSKTYANENLKTAFCSNATIHETELTVKYSRTK